MNGRLFVIGLLSAAARIADAPGEA